MKFQIVTLVFLCMFLAGLGYPWAAEEHPAGSTADEPGQPRLADQGALALRAEAGPVAQVWLTRGDESVKLQQQPSVQFQQGTRPPASVSASMKTFATSKWMALARQ
jgi:hypothetical protein